MSDQYGGNYLTITDEDGNEFELEHLDTIEYNGEVYMDFLPADAVSQEAGDGEADDFGLIILKVVTENGEEQLVTPDSEEELDAVYEQFMESLFDDEEDEEDE
jgi:uncharacterized protein YrzB (UPF0473 family)